MKKYLLAAAMTVAVSGAFVSCHDDNYSGSSIDKKAEAFEEAFIRAFGEPDPNHTWGFGDSYSALTRGENPDANKWADDGYMAPTELSPEQKIRVMAYFQANPGLTYIDPEYTDFFVQQVYKGGTTPGAISAEVYHATNGNPIVGSGHMDWLYMGLENGNPRQHINNFNYGRYGAENASDPNGLPRENVQNWPNITYLNDNGNGTHTDHIMLILGESTETVGFKDSEGSNIHLDCCANAGAEVIDAWALAHRDSLVAIGKFGATVTDDRWNRSFVGLDYEQSTIDQLYTGSKANALDFCDGNSQYVLYQGVMTPKADFQNFVLTDVKGNQLGYVTDDVANKAIADYIKDGNNNVTKDTYNKKLTKDQFKTQYGVTITNSEAGYYNLDLVLSYILQSAHPTQNNGNWVKNIGGRDYVFSDWIVTLTKAEKKGVVAPTAPQVYEQYSTTTTTGSTKYQIIEGTEVIESGRVMCEDLGSSELTDIDFNDIVFDAIIVREYRKLITTNYDASGNMIGSPVESYNFTNVKKKSGYDRNYALIRIMAAGGTIPATVAGYDVHNLLGGNSTTTMINTTYDKNDVNGANIANTEKAVDLTNDENGRRFYGIDKIKDIEIIVKYANDSKKLKAELGAVPYKFLVPLGTPWAKECKHIDDAYPEFSQWVKNEWKEFWNNPASGADYYKYIYTNDKLEGLSVEKDVDVYVVEGEPWTENSTTDTKDKRLVDAIHNKMDVPASSEIKLIDYNPSAPGYLYSDDSEGGTVTINDFSGNKALQVGDVIRVYGVSIANWEVNTTIISTPVKKADYITDCGYFEIPIEETVQALYINNHGLVFSGKHFTITYVTILRTSTSVDNNGDDNNGNDTGGENTGGENTGGENTGGNNNNEGVITLPVQIWPETGVASEQSSASIPGSKFNGITQGSILKIYCTFGPNNWFNCYFHFNNYPATMKSANNWDLSSDFKTLSATSSAKSSNGDCIELVLSDEAITEFQKQTLEFTFGNITVSRITIE